MVKKRRSAVDEVMGSDSPVSMKIKAQQAAARRAREEDGLEGASITSSASEVPRKPLTGPEPVAKAAAEKPREPIARRTEAESSERRAAKRAEDRREAARRSQEAPRNGKPQAQQGKKKQKPAKRIPVTGTEGDIWEGACRTMSSCVGAKVTFAAASRAIWSMIVDIEDDLERFDAPQLEKPAHADAVANADFEDQLRGFLLEVLQKTKRH